MLFHIVNVDFSSKSIEDLSDKWIYIWKQNGNYTYDWNNNFLWYVRNSIL